MNEIKAKKVMLVFCSGEIIEIDSNFIGDFIIENIKNNIVRGGDYKIRFEMLAETLAVEISHLVPNSKLTFEKFKDNSVRSVGISGGSGEKFYRVPFTAISIENAKNKYQDTYVSQQGNLYLTIDEKRRMKDIFDKKTIDKSNRDIHFRLCKETHLT